MTDDPTLQDHLDDWLALIDTHLAEGGEPLSSRPFHATIMLIQREIVKVRTECGETRYEPDGSTDFAVTPWFRTLYKAVEGWYRDHFGPAFDLTSDKGVGGVVLIRGTPFALRVPTSRVRPAELGKSIWVSFPDHVEDDDVVTAWLVTPPNLGRLASEDRAALEADIGGIGGSLRFIRTSIMGATGSDDARRGFQHGVVTHLERAAELIVRGDGDSVQKAWWELQMSIESALKGLILQKTGKHPFTHKLPELFDAAEPVGLTFDRARFAGWPEQREMSDLRYAQGSRRDITSVFTAYRLTLALVRVAADAMDRMRLGQARFKLQQPPWMRDDDASANADS